MSIHSITDLDKISITEQRGCLTIIDLTAVHPLVYTRNPKDDGDFIVALEQYKLDSRPVKFITELAKVSDADYRRLCYFAGRKTVKELLTENVDFDYHHELQSFLDNFDSIRLADQRPIQRIIKD